MVFDSISSNKDEDYFCADWDFLCDHLRLGAAASEFSEWVQVGIDVYIPHKK